MTQNTSTAVMQRRHEAHDSLDDFPTPPWATRALCEHVLPETIRSDCIWEPAANRGHMVRPLKEYYRKVLGTDIHDYGAGFGVEDFLFPGSAKPDCDWIITNPPFRLAEQFIELANLITEVGVAIFIRTAFLEGKGRFERLYSQNPPAIVAQFAERVVLHKGKLTATGSTATAYCWLVWLSDVHAQDTVLKWIPPCRKALERPDDYPEAGQ